MNRRDDLPDESNFDEYLKRGSTLSQRYKESSQAVVPPELDQKILMQARNAVGDKKIVTHPSWWTKWNKPLALAATLTLAVTVIYKVGYQSVDHSTISEAPAITGEAEVASTSATDNSPAQTMMDKTPGDSAPVSGMMTGGMKREAKRAEPLTASKQPSAPQAKEQEHAVVSVTAAEEPPRMIGSIAPPAITAPAPTESTSMMVAPKAAANGSGIKRSETGVVDSITVDSITSADVGKFPDANLAESLNRVPGVTIDGRNSVTERKKSLSESQPEAALQHIRDLRKQHKDKKADQAWKQFQKDFPAYPVAEDDVARSDIK